jgi:hypothetical protein
MHSNQSAGLHHPTVPVGPLVPFNQRTRLKLLVSAARKPHYLHLQRIEREIEKTAAR